MPLSPRPLTWHLRVLWWISAAGVRLGSAWNCLHQALLLTPAEERGPDSGGHRAGGGKVSPWVRAQGGQQLGLLGWWRCGVGAHSPCVGLAAGPGGGGVLEVACLTRHTVRVSRPDFIWQEKSKASQGEWARGESLHVSFRCSHGTAPPCPPTSLCGTFPDRPLAQRSLQRPCLCPGSMSLQMPPVGLSQGGRGALYTEENYLGGFPPPAKFSAPCPLSRSPTPGGLPALLPQ